MIAWPHPAGGRRGAWGERTPQARAAARRRASGPAAPS